MTIALQSNQAQNNPKTVWWKGGVLYQIYPRSFQDSNNDGIGDLVGITQRLPYLRELGVDAIWISPFFTSPMKDFGYDVSDYCNVDPMFGTLADCKELVAKAHEHNIQVMIDLVLSHTSDVHPWFVQSRTNADPVANPYADWYVWANAKDDGSPPNNWQSIFGGSSWQWDTGREQYYLHNFLTSQPDLNVHNLKVQEALLQVVKFWLQLGVNGFRLDTVNFYMHDPLLRDNPARGRPVSLDGAVSVVNPYSWQWHIYDKSQPENLVFLKKLRALLDEYPHTSMVGEIGDDNTLERIAEYTKGGDKLHMAYGFDLLGEDCSAEYLHGVLERFQSIVGDGWTCWSISNHDVVRVATRWGQFYQDNLAQYLRVVASLQLSLRGTPCIYQGDELGLPEADIAFEDLQDPYGKNMWPKIKGRDGCRTPMPWDGSSHVGFSQGKPWLPIAKDHYFLSVEEQMKGKNIQSLWRFYQICIRERRQIPELWHGEFVLLAKHTQVLAFIRFEATKPQQAVLCLFNVSGQVAHWNLPQNLQFDHAESRELLPVVGASEVEKTKVTLQAYSTYFTWVTNNANGK